MYQKCPFDGFKTEAPKRGPATTKQVVRQRWPIDQEGVETLSCLLIFAVFTSNKELLPSLIFVAFCCSNLKYSFLCQRPWSFQWFSAGMFRNYVAYSDNIKLMDNFGVFVLCLIHNDRRKLLWFLSEHCPKIGPSLNGLKWGLPWIVFFYYSFLNGDNNFQRFCFVSFPEDFWIKVLGGSFRNRWTCSASSKEGLQTGPYIWDLSWVNTPEDHDWRKTSPQEFLTSEHAKNGHFTSEVPSWQVLLTRFV